MSNSFDNKIKESLENFEMPYDANAWAALEKQLPQGGAPPAASSNVGLKIAALFAMIATTVATVWYLNKDTEGVEVETQTVEQVEIERNEIVEPTKTQPTPTTPIAETEVEVEPVNETKQVETVAKSESASTSKSEVESADEESTKTNTQPLLPETTKAEEEVVNEKQEITSTVPTEEFEVAFIASSLTACVGEEVSFMNESSNERIELTWEFGDGTSSIESNPNHSYVIPGVYTVRLTGAKGETTDEHSVVVTVNPSPLVVITPTKKLEQYQTTPLYSFSTPLQPTETAVWKFTDGMITKGANAEHLFRDAGKVGVELTVKNAFGCSASQDWTFDNKKFNLLAYTGFSPDGNGNNETFMPPALQFMGIDFLMVIRNQTGQIVYETSNPTEPWNGRLNNTGSVLEPGVYIWTVLLKDEILSKKDFNGTIKLKR